MHEKILTIISLESNSTKVKDYAGRLERELSAHPTYYYNSLAKLAIYLYKLNIPMLMTAEAENIKSLEISTQKYKPIIIAAQKNKKSNGQFIPQFCTLFVSKYLS